MAKTPYAGEVALYATNRVVTQAECWLQVPPGEGAGGHLINDQVNLASVVGRDHFVGARWTESIETPATVGEIRVFRGTGAQSLSPFMSTAPVYSDGELLRPGRFFRLYTRTGPPGGPMGPSRLVYSGHIDRSHFADAIIRVATRDFFSRVLDRQIEITSTYPLNPALSSEPVENMMQGILDQWADGWTLLVPTSPGRAFLRMFINPKAVGEELRRMAREFGWDVRMRWHDYGIIDHPGEFLLTLFDPQRGKVVPDWTMGPGEYIRMNELAWGSEDVRNAIEGIYGDDRARESVEDAASIAKYGRKFMRISESQTSEIDTQAEMQAMLAYALADLSEPVAEQAIERMYFPLVDLHDLVRYQPNGVHYDADMDLFTTQITHDLNPRSQRTTIHGRRNAMVARREWRTGEPAMLHISTNSPPAGAWAPEGFLWAQVDDLSWPP